MAVTEYVAGGPRPAEVMRDTWGHMDARPAVKYPGTVLFAEGAFGGERLIIHADFGDEAGNGPWFYEGIHAWLYEQNTQPGGVYLFAGWYRLGCDGDHEFVGTIRRIKVDDTAGPSAEGA